MRKRIATSQVIEGMFVDEFCGAWIDHPFWSAKFVVKDDREAGKIRESGLTHVWIDTARGADLPSAPEPAAASEAAPPPPVANAGPPVPDHTPTSTAEEARRAMLICEKSREAVESMFSDIRMGRAFSTGVASAVVEEISASVVRNQSALISLARLKTADDYSYMHSVAVCALMVALARQLQLPDDVIREAGTAGLLHDLGKALMPIDVLNKPGRLTREEFEVMKTHTVEGHRMLLESGTNSKAALDVCLHHHERMDGKGYPEQLPGDKISLLARMGAICDVYDAVTSNRPYKEGWNPAESISRMAKWTGDHFDERVFHAFVRSVGIYPVGSLVRMASGRIGIIIDQGTGLLTPRVKVFFSTASQAHIVPEIVDLSQRNCSDSIVGREDEKSWDMKELSLHWTAPAP